MLTKNVTHVQNQYQSVPPLILSSSTRPITAGAMASTMKRPPIWNTGLIQPERTRLQKLHGLPPSSPRTPTMGERGFRAAERLARIERWASISLIAVAGQCFWPFNDYQKYINYAFGAWFVWSLLPRLGGKAGRVRDNVRKWWAEHGEEIFETWERVWQSLMRVPGGVGWALRFWPTIFFAVRAGVRARAREGDLPPASHRLTAQPRPTIFTLRTATAHPAIDGPGLPQPRRRSQSRSSKQNPFVPRRGGEATEAMVLNVVFQGVDALSKERNIKRASGSTTLAPYQRVSSAQLRVEIASAPRREIGPEVPVAAIQLMSSPDFVVSEGSTDSLTTAPGPESRMLDARGLMGGEETGPNSATFRSERKGMSTPEMTGNVEALPTPATTGDEPAMEVPEPAPETVSMPTAASSTPGETRSTSYPPRAAPVTAPDASQAMLSSLNLKAVGLRTDCIGLWTTYHRLRKCNWPIMIDVASHRLLLQAAALEHSFKANFDVEPRLSRASYVMQLEALQRILDDALGLLQLFRQTLDSDNPSCPTLRSVRNCIAGILKSIDAMQGVRYKGTDSGVSDLRRQKLRLLIPDLAVEDKETARAAEELRAKEKEARDKAARERADRKKAKETAEKAEKDRIAAMSPMDSTEDKADVPPGPGSTISLPPGVKLRDLVEKYPIQNSWTPHPQPAQPVSLKGLEKHIKTLQTRLSQGFLPTHTSGQAFLCGLRAIIISLESMGKLQSGQVDPRTILRSMFVDPDGDGMNENDLPHGRKGRPTAVYQAYLDEQEQTAGFGFGFNDEWLEDVTSLQNFSAEQLFNVLQLLHRFGLEPTGEVFSLGIVTAARRNSPATVLVTHKEGVPENPDNVVWVFNDGRELASQDGKGIGHWSGFAKDTTDRMDWMEEVRSWGLKTSVRVEPTKGVPENPQATGRTQQGQGGHRDEPQRSAQGEAQKLKDLETYFMTQKPLYHTYEAEPTKYLREIRAMMVEIENDFVSKVHDVQILGEGECRDNLIKSQAELITWATLLIADLRTFLPDQSESPDNQQRRKNNASKQEQAGRRSQSARGQDDSQRGRVANQERPDIYSRARSDDGANPRVESAGRKDRGRRDRARDQEGNQREKPLPGPEYATGPNSGPLGGGMPGRGSSRGNQRRGGRAEENSDAETQPRKQNRKREGLEGTDRGGSRNNNTTRGRNGNGDQSSMKSDHGTDRGGVAGDSSVRNGGQHNRKGNSGNQNLRTEIPPERHPDRDHDI